MLEHILAVVIYSIEILDQSINRRREKKPLKSVFPSRDGISYYWRNLRIAQHTGIFLSLSISKAIPSNKESVLFFLTHLCFTLFRCVCAWVRHRAVHKTGTRLLFAAGLPYLWTACDWSGRPKPYPKAARNMFLCIKQKEEWYLEYALCFQGSFYVI